MFRSPKYCSRYDYTSIQLDTPITINPGNGNYQRKNGYQFTINDRSSHFDWYKAYFEVQFGINRLANADVIAADSPTSMINGAASLIDQLTIKQNGKTVFDNNMLYITANVKSLAEMSRDYAETTGTSEFFYLDDKNTTAIAQNDLAAYLLQNKGFTARQSLTHGEHPTKAKIPLNKFSFFEGLEHNMLPPSQIQISLNLTNDNALIYRTGGEACRVIVTKLVLWVPRMIFNPDGLSFVMENYMKPRKWTYLREMVQASGASREPQAEFRISAGVTNPKHVFVFLQEHDKLADQTKIHTLLTLLS